MTEPEPQDTNQKMIRSIVKSEGRKNSQRSVSFRGVGLEVLPEYPPTVQRSQKVGLFGIMRVLKEKFQEPVEVGFNQIKQVLEGTKKRYAKGNVNAFNVLFKLLVSKRLSASITSIVKAGSSSQSPSLLNSTLDLNLNSNRSSSANPKMIKRSQGAEYYHTQSQRSLKRPQFRDNDSKSVRSTDQVITKQQSQTIMCLSEEAKQALLEMQRFDRFIYVMQSEKRLKGPIESQLKRLEKIKNHYKCMRDTYYDNELTITCLFNHMKNMYEMNRDLGEIVKLKAEIERLERKIIDNNMKHTATLKELKVSNSNAKLAEDAAMLKEYLKMNSVLIGILKDSGSGEKTKNEIEGLIKSTPEDRRELLCLIQGRISGDSNPSSSIGGIYYSEISKLLEEGASADKSLKNIERVKKGFIKKMEECTGEEEHHAYEMLVNLSDRFHGLYTLSKSKDENEVVSAELKRVKSDKDLSQQRIRELETQLNLLAEMQSSVKHFEEVIGGIAKKVETDDGYLGDIVKNKRILTGKKLGISKLFCEVLGLLEILSKGDKRKQLLGLEGRMKEMEEVNKILSQELSAHKTNPEAAELNKFTGLFPNSMQMPEFTKILKYIELNKKKLPSYQLLLANISSLISSVLEHEKQKKRWESESTNQDKQKLRQLEGMEQTLSSTIKTLEENTSSQSISRLGKVVDSQLKKHQHLNQYQFNPLFSKSLKSISLLIHILEKSPDESTITRDREQQDKRMKKSQIQSNKLLKIKDDEVERLKEEIEMGNIRFNDECLRGKEEIEGLKRINEELQRVVNQGKVDSQVVGVLRQESQELKTLKAEMGKLKNESQQLARLRLELESVSKVKIENQQHHRTISQLKQSNLQLSSQVTQVKYQIQSKTNSLTLSTSNSISKAQYNRLLQQNQTLSRQLSQSSTNTTHLNNQLQEITRNNNKLSSDVLGWNLEKERLNQQIASYKREVESLQGTISKLSQQVEGLKVEVEYKSSSLNIPKHPNHHIASMNIQSNSNQSKERYYQQLYHSSKAENQQLRYQLAEVRSRENSTISRPSLISSMSLHDGAHRDHQKLHKDIEEYLYRIDSMEKERHRLIDQINTLTYQKEDLARTNINLEREVEGYRSQSRSTHHQAHSLSPSHSHLSQNQGTRMSSHVVIKSDNSSMKIQELQKEIKTLNGVIKDMDAKNTNQMNRLRAQQSSYQSPQIISTHSPRNSPSLQSLTREKSILQSQNKKLSNQVNTLLQRQRDLNAQLKRYQSDSHHLNQRESKYKQQYQEAEYKSRRLTDSHRLEISNLNQSIRKLTVQNSSMSLKMRDIRDLPLIDSKREDLLRSEIDNRKKSESYLEQKIKGLEANNLKLNQFIGQLEGRYAEQGRDIEKLRMDNLAMQRRGNSGGLRLETGQFGGGFEAKFSEILVEKASLIEKIESLERMLYNKDVKISKMLEFKEQILRLIVSELGGIQMELQKINQISRSERVLGTIKSITASKGRFQIQLLDAIKEKGEESSFHLQLSKKKRYSTTSFKVTEFIENNNMVLYNLLVFLTAEKWLEPCNEELPQESQFYFEEVEKFLVDLFERVFESKNEILDKQAHQLLMLREKMEDLIDQQLSEIEGEDSFRESEFDMGETKRKASVIALEHIFKLYLKTKSPQLLKEILNILNNQDV